MESSLRSLVRQLAALPDPEFVTAVQEEFGKGRSQAVREVIHLIELDRRGIARRTAYPTLYKYCVHVLRLSEDSAMKRVQTAKAARRAPGILDALADGRLHLAGVALIAPYMNASNSKTLIDAAMGKTKREIRLWLAKQFPQGDLPTRIVALQSKADSTREAMQGTATSSTQSMSAYVEPQSQMRTGLLEPAPAAPSHALEEASQTGPLQQQATLFSQAAQAAPTAPPAEHAAHAAPAPAAPPSPTFVLPRSPDRYALQTTIDEEAHALLREAQDLLMHSGQGHEIAAVLKRALIELVLVLKKRRFAQTEHPRARSSRGEGRYIPAEVRRAVFKRDGGRCTFVDESGERCLETGLLEFDHTVPFARGGRATAEGMRLLCERHNQFEAERAFGKGFMQEKRQARAKSA